MIDRIMVFIAPISGAAQLATIGHPSPMRRAVAETEATPIDEDKLAGRVHICDLGQLLD
jgi:hypothetical protein